MIRAILYVLAGLALLVVIFFVVVFTAMSIFGIAVVRSYMFGLFVTNYLLLGVPATLALAIWLATRRRDGA